MCPATIRKTPSPTASRVDQNRRFNRAIRKDEPVKKMLTRVGFDGSIRQMLLPVAAHDVEVAPDRSIGVLCSMDGDQHSSFDPETLEMAAIAPVARQWLARRRPRRLSRRRAAP